MMRRFHTQFTEKNLTGNAGLINLGRFTEKLGLPKILAKHLTIERAPNADYQVSDVSGVSKNDGNEDKITDGKVLKNI